MAIYYIENENGTFLSEDGKRKFMRLCSREAYDYLCSAEGKKKRFMKTGASEDGGETVFVEVPDAYLKKHREAERREQYVSDSKRDSGFLFLSLSDLRSAENDFRIESILTDTDADVEEWVLRKEELDLLRKALKMLTADERKLIERLYLSDRPVSERQLSREWNIPQTTLQYRKQKVLLKLRKYLDSTLSE